MSSRWLLPLLSFALAGLVRADGAADNLPDKVRPIPPKGHTLATPDRSDRGSTARSSHTAWWCRHRTK